MFTPSIRPRRLRRTPALREMVRETVVQPSDFIYPLFIKPGKNERLPIRSLPGIAQLSIDEAIKEAKEARGLGVPSLILFGIPKIKDATGSESYADDGIIQQAIRALKDAVPEMIVIADVCFCEYTDHGHCGVMRGHTLEAARWLNT